MASEKNNSLSEAMTALAKKINEFTRENGQIAESRFNFNTVRYVRKEVTFDRHGLIKKK